MSISQLQKDDRVIITKGRAAGIMGTIVNVKENQMLPFLVRFNNGGNAVGYTAKELRRF